MDLSDTATKIKSSIEKVKDFEVHGGSPLDFKETLVEFRDRLLRELKKSKDSSDAVFATFLECVNEVKKMMAVLDDAMMGPYIDDSSKEAQYIRRLATQLINSESLFALVTVLS